MPQLKIAGKRLRLKVKYHSETRKWYAAALDQSGHEVSISPFGDEHDAERYMQHFRKYGAWKQS
jgi:hypothetical protein